MTTARLPNIELFFDLVFVFAITQLSHRLLAHLTPLGALETLVLLLAVWWVWIYTSWVTNWLDPERAHVRLMLIILMAAACRMVWPICLPVGTSQTLAVPSLEHVTTYRPSWVNFT